jgi:preprotein translocase subunit SecE
MRFEWSGPHPRAKREDGRTNMAQAKAAKQPNVIQRLRKYFKDVWSELHRVVWPDRQDVLNSSVVVVVTLIIMTIFVTVFDNLASFVIIDVLGKIGR